MKKKKILFLCTGNSCRSQMAEGWARHLRSDDFQAYSAGIEAQGLNPTAIEVMKEAGVDISGQKSTTIRELKNDNFDIVVTVCDNARESCPVFPGGVKKIHAGFEDPPRAASILKKKGASLEEQKDRYRRVRDEIKQFVLSL